MQRRTMTKVIIALSAAVAYISGNLPPTSPWVHLGVTALNIGLLAYLGMREPGAKPLPRRQQP